MREVLIALATIGVGALLLITCVDYANAKVTTTLEEALERPVKVEKHVDKENGVVCYWVDQYPEHLECVYIPQPGLTWRNKRIIGDD